MTKILDVNELGEILKTTPPLSDSTKVYKKVSSVESITIPEGYEEIEHGTFCEIKGLKIINLPSTLKTIQHYAFWSCNDLKQINCCSPLVRVGYAAFKSCNNIENINMTMDISDEDGIDGLFDGFVPKSLKTFKLGKMVDDKVMSKTYKACEYAPLPNEIRIPQDDEDYEEYKHQYIAFNEDEQ